MDYQFHLYGLHNRMHDIDFFIIPISHCFTFRFNYVPKRNFFFALSHLVRMCPVCELHPDISRHQEIFFFFFSLTTFFFIWSYFLVTRRAGTQQASWYISGRMYINNTVERATNNQEWAWDGIERRRKHKELSNGLFYWASRWTWRSEIDSMNIKIATALA